GKGRELTGEGQQSLQPGAVGIETCLAHPLGNSGAAVPPLHDLRETAALLGREAEGLAEGTKRAARAGHDDGGGARRASATVLVIDILQHFRTPLVLEVDVDVGRLVALARDEALEQQRRAALR